MNSYRAVLIVASFLGAGAVAGCDYATKSEVATLRGQYRATHDTMVALWMALARDTVGPPVCPPKCEDVRTFWRDRAQRLPTAPSRYGSAP